MLSRSSLRGAALCAGLLPLFLLDCHAARTNQEERVIQGNLLPGVGDTINCQDMRVRLSKEIGRGAWGAVFLEEDGEFAVKVEIQKPKGSYSHFRDYAHECSIMKELEGTNVRVPRCLALCQVGNQDVFVMDLVKDAETITKTHIAEDHWKALARELYGFATGMLNKGIHNVDQDGKNILVQRGGNVDKAWFIDMGMAARKSELLQECRETGGSSLPSVKKRVPFIGLSEACEIHAGDSESAFVSAVLSAVPRNGPAMEGLEHAFCASTQKQLTRTKVWELDVDEDKLAAFKKAFKGVFAKFQKTAGIWRKDGNELLKGVQSKYDSNPIDDGAEILGIQFEGSYNLDYTSSTIQERGMDGWDANYEMRPGKYIFVKRDVPIVEEALLSKRRGEPVHCR